MAYRSRIIEKDIKAGLEKNGTVLIEGSMGVGKSSLLRHLSDRTFDVKKALENETTAMRLDQDPSLPFAGFGVHGIDGIDLDWLLQTAEEGLVIYTSSRATGQEHLTLYPLSSYESGFSNGAISLKGLFSGYYADEMVGTSEQVLSNYAEEIVKGGYPVSFGRKSSSYPKKVISTLTGGLLAKESKTDQSKKRTSAFLKRYAKSVGTIEKNMDLLRDLRGSDPAMAESTFYDYLNALKRLLIVEEVEAWCPPIKASPVIRRLAKKEFVDPSLACACLNLTPASLLSDPQSFQAYFESLCLRDLKVYAGSSLGSILHYEDRFGLMVDLVLTLKSGKYALIQCRLGEKAAKEGAEQMLGMRRKILAHDAKDPAHMVGLPAYCLVLTAGKKARRDANGVYYVPLSCLGE